VTARSRSKIAFKIRKREAAKLSRRVAAMKGTAAKLAIRKSEREQEALQRFRAAIDTSGDTICLIDRAKMRFIDVNDTGCRYLGYARNELQKLGPQDLLVGDPDTLEPAYDRLIANPDTAEKVEVRVRRGDGTVSLMEMHRRAMKRDGRWIIVSIARDIGERDADRNRAEKALRESEERYRRILEDSQDAYYEVDLKGNLVSFNSAFRSLLGYPEAELLGMNNRRFQSPEAASKAYQTFNQVYRTGVPAKAYDWEMQSKDGVTILVEGSVQLVKGVKNQPIGFRGMLRDVTSRRAMEQALRESEERFRSLIELSSDWYWEMDAQFRFSDLGKRPWETDIQAEGGWDAHRELLAAHRSFHDFVTRRRQPDGSWRYASITGEPTFDATGTFKGYRGIGCDITAEKLAEQRIQHLATHDSLTNLPNRAMFNELLDIAVQTAHRHAAGLSVLFIDLDGFKVINDSLGHEAGDQLLRRVGDRLKQLLRGSDVVARFGGDEFVVLLQEIADVKPIANVARKILSTIAEPVDLMGHTHQVTASIGISFYPTDGSDGSTLLKHADAAMYVVKDQGKNGFLFYSRALSP